jgi:hypothetical protein
MRAVLLVIAAAGAVLVASPAYAAPTADLGITRLSIAEKSNGMIVVTAVAENHGPGAGEPAIQVTVNGTIKKVTCWYGSNPPRRWSDGDTCEVYPSTPGIKLHEQVKLTAPVGSTVFATARIYALDDSVDPNPDNDSAVRSHRVR